MRQRKGRDWDGQVPRENGRRVLPNHTEAEASVLGGVILRNDALALIDRLEPEAFYDHRHKVVFSAMRNLEAALKPIDVVTLENEIAKTGKLDAIGGIAFLGELTMRVPTVDNVEEYAKIVEEKHLTRQVMLIIGQILDEGYSGDTEGEQMVHDISSALMTLRTGGDRKLLTVSQLIAKEAQRVIDDVEARQRGEYQYAGIPTGITTIDHNVGGHPIGIMTLYAARPASGKTTIASHIAHHAKRIADEDSLTATYEDSEESFGLRSLAQESGLETQALRSRRINLDDLVMVGAAIATGAARSELVLPAHGMSAEALVRRYRRENLKRVHQGKKPMRQLVVDYIQKIPWPDHARSENDAITHNSGVLSRAAGEESSAVVCMAQLSREVERRDDHEPRMSDLRGSGSLEQDAKFILGLWRPWTYDPKNHMEEDLHIVGLKNHNGEANFLIKMVMDVKSNSLYNTAMEWQMDRRKRADLASAHSRRAGR